MMASAGTEISASTGITRVVAMEEIRNFQTLVRGFKENGEKG